MGTWLDRLPEGTGPWLLANAAPPIRWRWLTEIVGLPDAHPDVVAARRALHDFPPSEKVLAAQDPEGTWRRKLATFEPPNPSRRKGPGMISEFLFLVERGFSADHPSALPVVERLLTDLVPSCRADLHEFTGVVGHAPGGDVEVRDLLFRLALAALTRAGLGDDPRVAPHADLWIERLIAQELGSKPPVDTVGEETDESGGVWAILAPGSIPLDHVTLDILAWSPRVRAHPKGAALRRRVVDRLFAWSASPQWRLRARGKPLCDLRLPRIVDWTPARFAEGGIAFLLRDLDLLARLGRLTDLPKALGLLEEILGGMDPDGAFRRDAWIEKHETPSLYPWFPLEESWRGKHKRYTDVTLRTAGILKTLDAS